MCTSDTLHGMVDGRPSSQSIDSANLTHNRTMHERLESLASARSQLPESRKNMLQYGEPDRTACIHFHGESYYSPRRTRLRQDKTQRPTGGFPGRCGTYPWKLYSFAHFMNVTLRSREFVRKVRRFRTEIPCGLSLRPRKVRLRGLDEKHTPESGKYTATVCTILRVCGLRMGWNFELTSFLSWTFRVKQSPTSSTIEGSSLLAAAVITVPRLVCSVLSA